MQADLLIITASHYPSMGFVGLVCSEKTFDQQASNQVKECFLTSAPARKGSGELCTCSVKDLRKLEKKLRSKISCGRQASDKTFLEGKNLMQKRQLLFRAARN